MPADTRISRLMSGLTPRERAVLCVRAGLEHGFLDPRVRGHMPYYQREEFNRLVSRANGVFHLLFPQVLLLEERVEVLCLRYEQVQLLSAWDAEREILTHGLAVLGALVALSRRKKPSGNEQLDYLPLGEAVQQFEARERPGEQGRPARASSRELRRLVADGTLRSRKTGRVLEIEARSLREHLDARFAPTGVPLQRDPVSDGPDAVQPAGDAADLWLSLDSATSVAEAFGAILDGWVERDLDALREPMAHRMKADFVTSWAQLLALETVVEEVAQGFQEDAVIPEAMRLVMAAIRSKLEGLRDDERGGFASLPLPPVDGAFLDGLRELVTRDARLYL